MLLVPFIYTYTEALHFSRFKPLCISERAVHPRRVGDIRWPGQKRRAVGNKRQHVINRRLRVLPTCPEWLRLARRARDTAATRLHHWRHRGESATKTIKFFVAHRVNYVICNNHTRIDWVLLNFTPVTQQNYHQPGRKFEKLFCAVDRLSCQNPKPANSEAILFVIS